MTLIVRRMALLAAILLTFGECVDLAVARGETVSAIIAASACGQSTRSEASRSGSKADPAWLLEVAERAIAAGNFDRAESLVKQAEALKPRYPFFYAGPTPARTRQKLAKARAATGGLRLPSQRFQPVPTDDGQPASRPADRILTGAASNPADRARSPAHPAPRGPADRLADAIQLPGGTTPPLGAAPTGDIDSLSAPTGQRPSSTLSAPALANPMAPMVGPSALSDQTARKQQALDLLARARKALAAGALADAQGLVDRAIALQVPNYLFRQGEDHPWLVALMVRNARRHGVPQPAPDGSPSAENAADHAVRLPAEIADRQVVPAAGDLLLSPPQGAADPSGEDAPLSAMAVPADQEQIPLPTHVADARSATAKDEPGLIDQTQTEQHLLERKVAADVIEKIAESRGVLDQDAKKAVEILRQTRKMVADSGLQQEARSRLVRRVDRSLRETEQYIEDHRAEIELDQRNREILEDIDRRNLAQQEVSERLAKLVEQFNTLRDQQRFAEMEVVAKRARELAPDHEVAKQMWENARFIVRNMRNIDLSNRKEGEVFNTLYAIEEASVPFDDSHPYRHGDAKEWDEISRRRLERFREGGFRRTEREQAIERKLKSPVLVQFNNTPLSEVMHQLMKLAGVNIHLDERGLAEEGVSTDTPVTIKLDEQISLESALNLILEELHLSYVIKDEVLKITSEQRRIGETYPRTYDVADLVIPIPNFVPGAHQGLQGALSHAQAQLGVGPSGAGFGPPMAVLASKEGTPASGMINPQVLAQMPGMIGSPNNSPTIPIGSGPGGLGGGVEPDFDSLIELITTTIAPDTWEEVGGTGSIAPFETNLSLVISQTQEVHEQIADLLEQLRRLQDLQVTIEVRFITLSDDFFERIGIDFDFNIEDGVPANEQNRVNDDIVNPSITVGAQQAAGGDLPAFTANLDIPFRQNSFMSALPSVGSFDAGSAATFGFAILSDIEAYFLVQAAQGDARANVLQAPKVTLFNGQQAFVQDTQQQPFVISVIPVVGDFAAAQQPVIVVLSEGTSLSVQAVVSPDRRYVRLTVVPFFSQIGDVDTFTFEGSTTSTSGSSSSQNEDDDSIVDSSENNTEIRQGTTVQLPTFAFVTVTTTVSVPDGGTVLLGGIKRLAEGRSEFGVPLLSKIPYVDRLFRNVGIGRETESLMMMVTPRIIIQEEEEELLLGTSPQ